MVCHGTSPDISPFIMSFLIRQTIIFTSLCGRPGTYPRSIGTLENSGTNRRVKVCVVFAPFCKSNITFCTINNLLFRISKYE